MSPRSRTNRGRHPLRTLRGSSASRCRPFSKMSRNTPVAHRCPCYAPAPWRRRHDHARRFSRITCMTSPSASIASRSMRRSIASCARRQTTRWRLLFEHGQRFEREVVEPLGYPAVEVEDGDWDEAFRAHVRADARGRRGDRSGRVARRARVWRGPICSSACRVESALGEFHYVPGT